MEALAQVTGPVLLSRKIFDASWQSVVLYGRGASRDHGESVRRYRAGALRFLGSLRAKTADGYALHRANHYWHQFRDRSTVKEKANVDPLGSDVYHFRVCAA